MMWDFSGGQRQPPVTVPPPSQQWNYGYGPSSYPAQPSVPFPQASAPLLTPSYTPTPPVIRVSHSENPGHHHRHHSHHHRSHSNPPPPQNNGVVYLQAPTHQSHHHRSHSNPPAADRGVVFVQPQPQPQSQPQPVQPIVVSHSKHHHHKLRRHHSQNFVQAPVQQHHGNSMPAPAPVVVPHHRHRRHSHNLAQAPVQYQHHTAPPPFPVPSPHQHPDFQYSKCTGRKRALCIGINYFGQGHELRGCINDAKHMRNFLIRDWGYKSEDIVLLTDDSERSRSQPTRKNILDAMRWLVNGAQPHDALFFHYSGHGGQTPDQDGDEADGYDEVIFPVDFQKRGHIVDDEMHDIMVKPLPAGCRLTAVFDSCHSGTVLDLPYTYNHRGSVSHSGIRRNALPSKISPADVISWSGCKDGQTSSDTFHGNQPVGAMSYAFIESLTRNRRQSYKELLQSVRAILYPKYSQKPQLGSSHHIDTNLRFII